MDYEERKQIKEEEEHKRERIKTGKAVLKTVLPIVLVVVGGWWIFSSLGGSADLEANSSALIAKNGLHWHANLSMVVKGEKSEVPANLGIGAIHQPIHTHEADGLIHMEFNGPVRERDLRLGKFFDIWGETFTKECIFKKCNGGDGKVIFSVNGKPNDQFGDYIMQDNDVLEISFE